MDKKLEKPEPDRNEPELERFVVLPDKACTHAGLTYLAGETCFLPRDVAAFHVREGSLRAWMAEVDGTG